MKKKMNKKINETIFMPNEIIDDLRSNIKTSRHVAFAYAYYYYVSYLYRYCKYCEDKKNTQSDIKEKLGSNKAENRVNYLIKKDGILDSLGYTKTTDDYPVEWYLDEDNVVVFKTINSIREEYGKSKSTQTRNYKVKIPVKCFHRTGESLEDNLLDGTFYDVSHTYKIDYKIFDVMMKHKDDLGVTAFYIYGFLKSESKSDMQINISYKDISKKLGISLETLSKYLKSLENFGFIDIDRVEYKKGNYETNCYKILRWLLKCERLPLREVDAFYV